MAKKAAKKSTPDLNAQVDSMFDAVMNAAKTKFGDDIFVGSSNQISQIGLPLPSLAVCYLFQANIFPLGRVWQLAGQEGSCKSALMYELLRWHLVYGGCGNVKENENKDSEVLRNGILEYRDDWLTRRVKIQATNSLDEWQAALTEDMAAYSKEMDRKGGVGRTVPVLFGIDSLTATDTQSNIDKISKDGFASRGYAEQANLISRYMRSVPKRMRGFPFTIVGTNHLKPATDAMGRPTSTVPGGKAVPFMATFMIESKRIADIEKENYAGVRLKLKMAKNSFGPSRHEINVEFLWWWAIDPNDGIAKQHFYWDWHAATVEMLLSFDVDGKRKLFKQLKEITGLNPILSKKVASSEVLGISADSPVPYRDWGRALESRPDILAKLYPLLGIGTYKLFQTGVDFRALQAQSRQEASHANAALYQHVENLPTVDPDELDPLHETEEEFED